ncbi:glutaredoxin family protein [Undibacterium sp.]|jgi:mycoredoxin|uniref:glutaredoxin family protein n=1 Tax=Undibacterium sp. TaxID=1914977 RepID=UPI002C894A27|nr:glutaredoxin family protein [Undibacterium sp.]HTD03040.1 glutaredoxin family protein [Undibacterium sp.]
MNKRLKAFSGYVLILAAGLGVGYAASHAAVWLKPAYREGNYSAYFPNAQSKVVLYGTSWCAFCAKTRSYLREHNINFVDLDIEKSPAAAAQHKQLGGGGVPVVLIGDRKIQGFNSREFDAAISRLSDTGGS